MTRPISKFLSRQDGSASVWSLMMIGTFLYVGGYAIDVSNLSTETIRLQAAVDSAAHAALVERELNSSETAKTKALALAEFNLPADMFGDILTNESIVFGNWDPDTRTFTADPDSKDAVRATVFRNEDNGNALSTFLWQVAGVDNFNLAAQSTYETYIPTCFREGFVATAPVDIQSNNSYFNGFCIHSNSYVSMNSNNFFQSGTVVSMPDLSLLDLPNSGFATNTGLEASLREGSYNIRIIQRIDNIVAEIDDAGSEYLPDYITDTTNRSLSDRSIDEHDLAPGKLYTWDCRGNGGTISSDDAPIERVVIVTACKVTFGANTTLEDVVIVNSNTGADSFKAPSGLNLGADDDCAEGGGVQLVTLGGMNFASNLAMFGSQLLAIGDIEFSARADGFEGAAIVSNGTISGTSNMSMAFCGTGMESNFVAEYFRLVE